MPKCPQCLKSFSTSRGVTAHLAQKRSKCNSWEREYIGLHIKSGSEAVEEYSSSKYSSSTPSSPLPRSFELLPTPDGEDFEMSFEPDPPAAIDPFNEDQSNGEQEDSRPSVAASATLLTQLGLGRQIQSFPGAGSVIAIGETFLDRFGTDTYSFFRRTNIYYPFANHDDWQMASYLLRSDLSMAKIDEYLRLNLVCLFSQHTLRRSLNN